MPTVFILIHNPIIQKNLSHRSRKE